MFIRRKTVNDLAYYTLVENYRENGKVRQRVIAPLGRCATLHEAIAETRHWIAQYRKNCEDHPRIESRQARYLFFGDDGSCTWLVVGKEAGRRAEKLERKLKVLNECLKTVETKTLATL